MALLDLLEKQPNFPREDLTETNATYLGLAMGNPKTLHSGHELAKREYRIFIGTHDPLLIATGNLFEDARVIKAIDFGIAALEAITLFVAADQPKPAIKVLEGNINSIVSVKNTAGVSEYFEAARAEFLAEAPRTAEVIAEGADRVHVGLAYAAVYGGAIARRFELDCVED